MEQRLISYTQNMEAVKRLRTIPGVALMTACALVAVADDIARFDDAKSFASYLGLVPTENSSGDKRRMGKITRSGSEILRRYLIHGARSVITASERYPATVAKDHNKLWALKVKKRSGMNKACVALAHRMSRVAFAMLRDGESYITAAPSKLGIEEFAQSA